MNVIEPPAKPDWGRPGETWRIEVDLEWSTDVADEWLCASKRCDQPAVAYRSRHGFAQCAPHLLTGGMWVLNGKVVAWTLRP